MTQKADQARSYKKRGFRAASDLVAGQIRNAGETRGFAVSRLLTQWAEIVGSELAEMALPVKVSYAQAGMGATLTVLTKGAHAPILQSQVPQIREKVNACYGYAAISHIRITQTAPTGFAEGQVAFSAEPEPPRPEPSPEMLRKAQENVTGIRDQKLRSALEALGQNVLSRSKK